MGVSFDRSFWLNQFGERQSLKAFSSLVDRCYEELGSLAVFTQHGTNFWRDAWVASKAAYYLNATEVRLLEPIPFPDFALYFGDVEQVFEATEIIRSDRRRGDELKGMAERGDTILSHPEDQWLTPESAGRLLSLASEKKARKRYAQDCGLVIYLNETDYDLKRQETLSTFVKSTRAAGEVFQTVDILFSERMWRTWVNQKPVGEMPLSLT